MIIKLYDKTELTVSNEQAEKIKQAINDDAKMIDINGVLVRPNAIYMIKPGGTPPPDPNRTLPATTATGDPPEKTAANRKKIREFLAGRKKLVEHKGL